MGIEPPVPTIIGEVVSLRERLNWRGEARAARGGAKSGAAEIVA